MMYEIEHECVEDCLTIYEFFNFIKMLNWLFVCLGCLKTEGLAAVDTCLWACPEMDTWRVKLLVARVRVCEGQLIFVNPGRCFSQLRAGGVL